MVEDGGYHHYIFYIVLTALLLSLLVFGQVVTTYATAFRAAPREIQTFVDALEFSSQENESYDNDVEKVQSKDDRVRLNRLLSDIQKCTDEFSAQVNSLTRDNSNGVEPRKELRKHARAMWASKRPRLEESVRRLDLLRMRFLVLYMGMVANQAPTERSSPAPTPKPIPTPPTPPTPQQLMPTPPVTPRPPPLPKSLTDAILKGKPQLKKISTAPVTRNEKKSDQPMGWAGVIAELQKSPLMHKRHQSIETAMAEARHAATTTPSPSPLSSSPSRAA